ncbi:MAG: ACP S-malonyltransferase [Caldisericia bacterium]|nr:ACP S-malonyltransferase [Caldisericia bacterium]MDD4613865.1 ACP S-malonyltransferase [Caldisericia bacterium]
MKHTSYVFPGQGSQYSGMMDLVPKTTPTMSHLQVFEKEMGKPIEAFTEEEITLTQFTQPIIYTISSCYLEWLQENENPPSFLAGHSLGEISALFAGGVLSFEEGLAITMYRGKLMEEVTKDTPGGMCAIIGLPIDTVQALCNRLQPFGVAEAVNINAEKQVVISGSTLAMEKAPGVAKEMGARMCIPLKVSAPFHSSLMKPIERKFSTFLQTYRFKDAKIPIVQNVDAQPHQSARMLKYNLIQQLSHPVLWKDSLDQMISKGVTNAIEVGPKNVLSGLCRGSAIQCVPVEVLRKNEQTS